MEKHKTGVYETIYGNAASYISGRKVARDLDMGDIIPLEVVNFEAFIREYEEGYDFY